MLPRCYLFAKNVCQKAAVSSCEKNCSITLNVAVRQLYLLHRNTQIIPLNSHHTRQFTWTQNLLKKRDTGKQTADQGVDTNEVVSSKTTDKDKKDEPPTPVLKIIAPEIQSNTNTKSKDKVVLDNVLEQSLDKKVAKPVISEPIKKLKEKIIGISENKNEEGKTQTKKRKRVDLSAQSLERNFITPVRAMSDFLLKPSDLESLPKTKRRSPYENEPPITVYWRKDVEAKALSIWGSRENLQKELIKRDIERKKYQQNIFTMKRRLRDYRRELGRSANVETDGGIMGRSGKVVLTAIAINGTNCLFKLFAWLYTGSHSMFSECIHSLADTINQLILAYGIHKSVQVADSYHPYGYTNMKYVASLISGVGIFCVGTGLSLYHGISGLVNPQPIDDFFWAYFILGGSVVSEGATWLVAYNSIRRGARNINMSVKDYILRSQDPSVNVVLLEDFAAVVGVIVAAGCMGLSSVTNSSIPDAIGSLLVGCILGSVASFIIYTNVAALVGRSIPEESLDKINTELESDVMVRAIHDVKGIDMGNYLVRYKAELDFDGRELTRSYLDKQDLNELLEEARRLENIDQFEEFMLKHGENIVDMMGGEIDRIEMKLRKKHPEIRHCDLEIL
ncbi:Zinc transporter 9-like Protein [Tribolium castaneum]|uniref:Proton-coupled zinc antiporter SLC30A9, mitochondrial n=1 Tax=Tribolium castaneum TaxID=7070 RepID=D2A035_TRICA|nr:PREDICTED: zinc transporter 9 isoform X1 [Tribolium castaneum]EFA01750.2 Zinc transporter 9-like Protein [Tribolium castaneum]|eukprot:XP_975475.2 PREDICTED: zinc transporter 9 isoform X1 [Tribolium castaneum]